MHFQDELPPGRSVREEPVDWPTVKAEMIANEGKWGLVAQNISNSTPQQIAGGRYKDFQGPELEHFEFKTRKPDDSTGYGKRRTDLWGRYTKVITKRLAS